MHYAPFSRCSPSSLSKNFTPLRSFCFFNNNFISPKGSSSLTWLLRMTFSFLGSSAYKSKLSAILPTRTWWSRSAWSLAFFCTPLPIYIETGTILNTMLGHFDECLLIFSFKCMILRSRLCIFICVQRFVTSIHYWGYYRTTLCIFFLSLLTFLNLNKCIYTYARLRKWRVKLELELVKDNQTRNSICQPHTFSFSLFLSSPCIFAQCPKTSCSGIFLTEENTFF